FIKVEASDLLYQNSMMKPMVHGAPVEVHEEENIECTCQFAEAPSKKCLASQLFLKMTKREGRCIVRWSKVVSNCCSERHSSLKCPFCKRDNYSIVYECDGNSFQQHYINGDHRKNIFFSAAHKHRLRCYYSETGSSCDKFNVQLYWKFRRYLQPNKWLQEWLTREVQALTREEDVNIVVQHIVGVIESFVMINKREVSNRTPEQKRQDLKSLILDAARPFLSGRTERFVDEVELFLASGLTIQAYDQVYMKFLGLVVFDDDSDAEGAKHMRGPHVPLLHFFDEESDTEKANPRVESSLFLSMTSFGINEGPGKTVKDLGDSIKIGDRATSDVVVRLRTEEGRDDWLYCHSHILLEKSTFFAERLSDNWPTCQILDSRNCVEVYCQEPEFNYHVTALRLLYGTNSLPPDTLNSVRNALGLLRVSVELGCHQMIRTCVDYLEAVPWEETEEEEILRVIPRLGSQAEQILARLQPVNAITVSRIFLSAFHFATSSPPPSMNDLKSSAQEQLEYMLTEDDDAPLLTTNDEIKLKVKEYVGNLLNKFYDTLDSFSYREDELRVLLHSLISDLVWASQILAKMETMREFVQSWLEQSDRIVKALECSTPNPEMLETVVKVIEVAAKVLEAMAYGTVILPAAKRLQMVKSWVPFVRITKPLVDDCFAAKNEDLPFKMDNELWQSLESAFVSLVLALPSGDQEEILTDWLGSEQIRYPDLTEAFEVWCYRSKVAKRRLELLGMGRVNKPCL
ncbi:hypothetical protein GIB67_042031, partial [Kingdonia uniflora]